MVTPHKAMKHISASEWLFRVIVEYADDPSSNSATVMTYDELAVLYPWAWALAKKCRDWFGMKVTTDLINITIEVVL